MSAEQTDAAGRFLALLRPIERELEVHCRRLIWHGPDAPDALQNAVLRAFKAFDRYHDEGRFRQWMFRILTNEVFRLNRKYERLAQFEYQVEPETLDSAPALEPDGGGQDWLNGPAALAEALDQELVAGLKTLTETERGVLLLRAIGEFRYREIAEILDLPMGSVMGNLSRARQKLRSVVPRAQRRPAP
jgi:RNA polymerase sigma-70 factor (ECF subfamily)